MAGRRRAKDPTAADALRKSVGASVNRHLAGYAERLTRSRLDEKLFRDPIFGFQRLRPYEVLIIDSPLFQRLRGIFQTAVAYLTYPSSIHTRFEHSINCLHLANRVVDELRGQRITVDPTAIAEVRLAALLHDVGHCVFSHGSEFFYRTFPELEAATKDAEVSIGSPSEGEIVNYCILTSTEFRELLWEPILSLFPLNSPFGHIQGVSLKRVAQMIIGAAPDDDPSRCFQTDIVNGPFDVDKLDYLTRDAYFTGISLTVDIERLLPSLRVVEVDSRYSARNRKEHRLVVDHRGIAVVEQLLFARMVLYDTVYHHHKVRAANALLQAIFRRYAHEEYWPTPSKRLDSIADLLSVDEYDFFGATYTDANLRDQIKKLRFRNLPERALVIAPRALADGPSHTKWSLTWADKLLRTDPAATRRARSFFDEAVQRALRYAREAGATDLREEEVVIDVPEPPKYGSLGERTLIQIVSADVTPLAELFPFQKVVNNYSTEYKYRSYVFAPERWKGEVAYGAYRAFSELGVRLNDLALALAHQERGGVAHKHLVTAGLEPPDWRKAYYAPDEIG